MQLQGLACDWSKHTLQEYFQYSWFSFQTTLQTKIPEIFHTLMKAARISNFKLLNMQIRPGSVQNVDPPFEPLSGPLCVKSSFNCGVNSMKRKLDSGTYLKTGAAHYKSLNTA